MTDQTTTPETMLMTDKETFVMTQEALAAATVPDVSTSAVVLEGTTAALKPDTTAPAAPPADTTLWCIRIVGPDDLMACASRALAHRNALWHNLATWPLMAEGHPYSGSLAAVPEPWPYSPDSHAEDLEERNREDARWSDPSGADLAGLAHEVLTTTAPTRTQVLALVDDLVTAAGEHQKASTDVATARRVLNHSELEQALAAREVTQQSYRVAAAALREAITKAVPA